MDPRLEVCCDDGVPVGVSLDGDLAGEECNCGVLEGVISVATDAKLAKADVSP